MIDATWSEFSLREIVAARISTIVLLFQRAKRPASKN